MKKKSPLEALLQESEFFLLDAIKKPGLGSLALSYTIFKRNGSMPAHYPSQLKGLELKQYHLFRSVLFIHYSGICDFMSWQSKGTQGGNAYSRAGLPCLCHTGEIPPSLLEVMSQCL